MPLSTLPLVSSGRVVVNEIRRVESAPRQRGNHLLAPGEAPSADYDNNSRRGRANLLHHQREVGAAVKSCLMYSSIFAAWLNAILVVNPMINLKIAYPAPTPPKQAIILRRNALKVNGGNLARNPVKWLSKRKL